MRSCRCSGPAGSASVTSKRFDTTPVMRTSGQILCAVSARLVSAWPGNRGAGERLAAALEHGFDRRDHAVAGERLREPRLHLRARDADAELAQLGGHGREHVEPERRAAFDLGLEPAADHRLAHSR